MHRICMYISINIQCVKRDMVFFHHRLKYIAHMLPPFTSPMFRMMFNDFHPDFPPRECCFNPLNVVSSRLFCGYPLVI